jgi:hypothetical protein
MANLLNPKPNNGNEKEIINEWLYINRVSPISRNPINICQVKWNKIFFFSKSNQLYDSPLLRRRSPPPSRVHLDESDEEYFKWVMQEIELLQANSEFKLNKSCQRPIRSTPIELHFCHQRQRFEWSIANDEEEILFLLHSNLWYFLDPRKCGFSNKKT